MTNRIVVAVDNSPSSRAALRWAYARASEDREPLLAVHVLELTERHARPTVPGRTELAAEASQRQMMATHTDVADDDSLVHVTISEGTVA